MGSPLVIASSPRYLSVLLALCLWATGAPTGCGSPKPSTPPAAAQAEAVSTSASPAPTRPRGLWVLCEGSQRVLEHPSRVAPLLETASALAVTDLFVQVHRGGKSWYASGYADPSPHQAMLEASGGADPLAELIERAHARGIRVHAWVNVLSLSQNPDAPILEALGPGAVLVDRAGRSILDYPDFEVPAPDRQWYRMGTRGVYLDPAAPGVTETLTATFAELVAAYPELDGLHLDYIRHPGVLPFVPGSRFGVGLDFGYGLASRVRFGRETGLPGPYRSRENPSPDALVNTAAWDAWRRDKVTELVASIAAASRAARPGLVVSAAVIAYADRAYLSLAQDWMRWLEEGLIDLAIPMAYTKDDRLLGYQLEGFGRSVNAARIWPGLGVWLFARSPGRAVAQVEAARAAGVAGDVLFSYDAIAEAPGLEAALAAAPAGGSH